MEPYIGALKRLAGYKLVVYRVLAWLLIEEHWFACCGLSERSGHSGLCVVVPQIKFAVRICGLHVHKV